MMWIPLPSCTYYELIMETLGFVRGISREVHHITILHHIISYLHTMLYSDDVVYLYDKLK